MVSPRGGSMGLMQGMLGMLEAQKMKAEIEKTKLENEYNKVMKQKFEGQQDRVKLIADLVSGQKDLTNMTAEEKASMPEARGKYDMRVGTGSVGGAVSSSTDPETGASIPVVSPTLSGFGSGTENSAKQELLNKVKGGFNLKTGMFEDRVKKGDKAGEYEDVSSGEAEKDYLDTKEQRLDIDIKKKKLAGDLDESEFKENAAGNKVLLKLAGFDDKAIEELGDGIGYIPPANLGVQARYGAEGESRNLDKQIKALKLQSDRFTLAQKQAGVLEEDLPTLQESLQEGESRTFQMIDNKGNYQSVTLKGGSSKDKPISSDMYKETLNTLKPGQNISALVDFGGGNIMRVSSSAPATPTALRDDLAEAQASLESLNKLEEIWNKMPHGRLVGNASRVANTLTGYDNDISEFNSLFRSAGVGIYRGTTGDKRVNNEDAKERAQRLVPGFGAQKDEGEGIFNNTRDLLETRILNLNRFAKGYEAEAATTDKQNTAISAAEEEAANKALIDAGENPKDWL